ncbi:MAG: T9SS type B sorting domain-containing protein [Bacteroidetes bacterium]|nr:MAG: T9SS type B sorting domain-containing protein [Bacteroidota bacterium]
MLQKTWTYLLIFLSGLNICFSQADHALHFDGQKDFVTLDSLVPALAASNDFTIEFWMKANFQENTVVPRVNLFTINPPAPGENKFAILLGSEGDEQTGHLSIFETKDGNFYLSSPSIIGDLNCHHIAYVRKGNQGEAFVDGVSIGTIQVQQAVEPNDRISIGQDWDNLNPSDFYRGYMNDLRIWTVARSEAQIKNYMNRDLTGAEGGLIAYYKFDQGVAGGNNTGLTQLIDLSGAGNHGTLVGFNLSGNESNWVKAQMAPDFELGVDTTICAGQTVTLGFNGAKNYLWSNNSQQAYITVSEADAYWLIAGNGACTNVDTIRINVHKALNSQIIPDTLCEGKQKTLQGKELSVFSYLWSTGDTTAQIVIQGPDTYTVERENACGFSQITYEVISKECPCQVYLPNSFTPNGDKHNQLFKAVYDCELAYFSLRVFNRWGQLIFESNDPESGWNGSDRNGLIQNGLYVFQLDFTPYHEPENERKIMGHVSLIR